MLTYHGNVADAVHALQDLRTGHSMKSLHKAVHSPVRTYDAAVAETVEDLPCITFAEDGKS